jgi:hypothetical protein
MKLIIEVPIDVIEALIYYSQIHEVTNVRPAGMLSHKAAWLRAQQHLWDQCEVIDSKYQPKKPVEHLPLSRERADPSVLVETRMKNLIESCQNLFDEKKSNPKNKGCGLQNAWNNLAFHLGDARKALTTYKESKPSQSITREQAEKVWDAATAYALGSIEKDIPDKSSFLKQYNL